MESETLFKEEEEPPGHLTGLVHAKNNVSDFLLFSSEIAQSHPIKQKSDSALFPFKDSTRSRIFRTTPVSWHRAESHSRPQDWNTPSFDIRRFETKTFLLSKRLHDHSEGRRQR